MYILSYCDYCTYLCYRRQLASRSLHWPGYLVCCGYVGEVCVTCCLIKIFVKIMFSKHYFFAAYSDNAEPYRISGEREQEVNIFWNLRPSAETLHLIVWYCTSYLPCLHVFVRLMIPHVGGTRGKLGEDLQTKNLRKRPQEGRKEGLFCARSRTLPFSKVQIYAFVCLFSLSND